MSFRVTSPWTAHHRGSRGDARGPVRCASGLPSTLMSSEAPPPAMHEREWFSPRPVAVAAILGAFRQGSGDPCYHSEADGMIWRAVVTPSGPATLAVRAHPASSAVVGRAWGPGAQWLLDGFPE